MDENTAQETEVQAEVTDTVVEEQNDSILSNAPSFEIPDDYKTEDGGIDNEKMYNTLNEYKDKADALRRKLSNGDHKAPESADQYIVDIPEDMQQFIPSDDPMVTAFKNAAHKHGYSQDIVSNLMGDIVSELSEKQVFANISKPLSEEEQAARRGDYIKSEMSKLGDNAPKVINSVNQFITEQTNEGVLTKEQADALQASATSAGVVSALNALRTRITGQELIPVSAHDAGVKSKAELTQMAQEKDANGQPRIATDLEFRRQYEQLVNQAHKAGSF